MNQQAIQAWLKRKKAKDATARLLLAGMALMGGLVILFFTFWFTYAIIWFCVPGVSAVSELAFGKKLRLTHEWRLLLSGGWVLLLLLQHLRTNPWHWGDYDQVNEGRVQALGQAFGPLAALLSAPGASANMIADILLSGPRLATGSGQLWRESRRLSGLDEAVCAQLLAFLASRPGAVSYEELRAAGWEEWFAQLRCLEGVIFLEKGITLSGEFREELLQIANR